MLKLFFILFFFIFFFNFWNFMYLIIMMFFIMIIMYYPSFYIYSFNSFIFLDNLNYLLILLTLWIIFLMIISMNLIKFNYNYFNLMLLMVYLMVMFLLFSFLVFNYLFFYMFFEMSLIPILYMILGWGNQPERILAGLYMLFYTLLASLPLLLGILFLNNNFKILLMMNFNYLIINEFLYYSLMLAFLVKMPMFMVHLWLPKAHVEAPISGSMILAAVLLKLGGYGILRVMFFLLKFNVLNLFFLVLSVYGGILISLNCLRQLDMKMLIAYSSVAHMGLILGGVFTMTYWGVSGGFLMMIAHGLCSSGLFCLANISYERLMTRSMLINKGLINFMPSMALWWFLLSSSNMSAPLSLNLISEIKLINSLMSWSLVNMFLLMLLCFFSASYSYYLYSYSQHGLYYSSIFSFSNNNQREIMLVFFHWFPLNILFLKVLFLF